MRKYTPIRFVRGQAMAWLKEQRTSLYKLGVPDGTKKVLSFPNSGRITQDMANPPEAVVEEKK